MKKIIALLMAVWMTVGMLAACSNTPAETNPPAGNETQGQAEVPETSGEKEKVTLKVWADQGELELIEKLCNEFAAAHTQKEYTFAYGAVGAVDGKTRYLEDPAAAADVFLLQAWDSHSRRIQSHQRQPYPRHHPYPWHLERIYRPSDSGG